jgi:hypothetical protein
MRLSSPIASVALVCAAAGVFGPGCAEDDASGDAGGDPPVGHAPNGDYLLPAGTLTDWVSYTEQLSAVTVLSEEEIPPPDSVLKNREGHIFRRIRLGLDETIWVNKGVTPLAGELGMNAWGWYLKGDQRRPSSLAFSPRLEVGGRYVMALTRYAEGWGVLTPESVFAVDGDPIATRDVRAHGYSPVAHQLAGKTFAEIAALLQSTPPDAIAEKYWDLLPAARYQAVAAEQNARDSQKHAR